jgi:NAD(P)-dependent dehydrogenase (short-subunit alcohol dehydrogenase family)
LDHRPRLELPPTWPTLQDLRERVAVVTGGGRGLGFGLAAGLAHYGADVVVAGRDAAGLENTAHHVVSAGRRCLTVPTDVRDVAQCQALIQRTVSEFGRVDILVNNAGIGARGAAEDLTEADWDLVLDTNLKGMFFASQAAARAMIPTGYGRIVNIASIFGAAAFAGSVPYSTSKGGVIQLTRTLAVAWAKQGLTVNAVGPAFIDSPLNAYRKADQELERQTLAAVPLGRWGKVEDVVSAVVFLASDAAAFITGHTLFVDGGYLAV